MTLDPRQSGLVEHTEREKLWRCPECGDEKPFAVLEKARHPRWCLGEGGSHRAIPFERSDWGLLAQAVEHYKRNRQRSARRNPAADAVLARGVYPRFDAMMRAFGELRRAAPGDTEDGGRIVQEWPSSGRSRA